MLPLLAHASTAIATNGTCATPQLRYAQPPMVALGIPPCSFPARPLELAVTSCNYVDNCDVAAVAAAGVHSILLDLNWATFDVRPNISSPPAWSSAAWAPVAAHIQAATQSGLRVLVGPGAHVPPQYIWDAGARFGACGALVCVRRWRLVATEAMVGGEGVRGLRIAPLL